MGRKNRWCVVVVTTTKGTQSWSLNDHVSRRWHGISGVQTKLCHNSGESVAKSREDFKPGPHVTVCSNHFIDGKRTKESLVFGDSSEQHTPSPKKQGKLCHESTESPSSESVPSKSTATASKDEKRDLEDSTIYPSFLVYQITWQSAVKFYAGQQNTSVFRFLFRFGWLVLKANHITYRSGGKKATES